MDDIEEQLRRYRPAGPPSALRARVLDPARQHAGERRARRGAHGVREWFPVAAAMILIVLFSWMTSIERRKVDARLPASIQDVATTFGTGVK